MSNPIEVRVPDIGDFTDVPVIEILVQVGDVSKLVCHLELDQYHLGQQLQH